MSKTWCANCEIARKTFMVVFFFPLLGIFVQGITQLTWCKPLTKDVSMYSLLSPGQQTIYSPCLSCLHHRGENIYIILDVVAVLIQVVYNADIMYNKSFVKQHFKHGSRQVSQKAIESEQFLCGHWYVSIFTSRKWFKTYGINGGLHVIQYSLIRMSLNAATWLKLSFMLDSISEGYSKTIPQWWAHGTAK